MSMIPLVLIYLGMLAFDFGIIAGSVYMVAAHGWSAWWVLAGVIICIGSNPMNVIRVWNKQEPIDRRKL